MNAIEANGLGKDYGKLRILKDCTFAVPEGSIFGLLGPNGAGKSTLIRTLLGFQRPSRGRASVLGYDVLTQSLEVRKATSYLPGDARFYRAMKGKAVLELFSGLHPQGCLKTAKQIAEQLQLDLSRRVMFMSTGMRQKLGIAVAMGCLTEVIILDEPTANLDPTVRTEVLRLVREAKLAGRTILFSSHIYEDIDAICDEVAILRDGRVEMQQDMRELDTLHVVKATVVSRDEVGSLTDFLDQAEFCHSVQQDGTELTIQLVGDPNSWLPWLSDSGLQQVRIAKAGISAIYDVVHKRHSSEPTQAMECEA